jgi:class 3 adenylate cyclase
MARQRKPSSNKAGKGRPGRRPAKKQPARANRESPATGPTPQVLTFYSRLADQLAHDATYKRSLQELSRKLANVPYPQIDTESLSRLLGTAWQAPRIPSEPVQKPELRRSPPPDEKAAVPEVGRLRAHAPPRWDRSADAKRLARAIRRKESTPLIVMAADIRASNILMKEAVDLYRYASILEAFTQHARETVWDSKGLFDKFTGDGFLAYWSYTPTRLGVVLRRVFGVARKLFATFFEEFIPEFRANSQNFPGGIGLAIGLDEGVASIVAIADEPTIVGPAVVGATRMVEVAHPWETLANVRLGEHLVKEIAGGRFEDIQIEPQVRRTKEYDEQTAYQLDLAGPSPPPLVAP